DMGGFFLAKELAGGDVAAWLYSGLILGSMMGPTIGFSIPVALGIIEPTDRRHRALGALAGYGDPRKTAGYVGIPRWLAAVAYK
ncbi:ethanolamine utilization protein EutH, partial [Salmonella enterica]|uniref:ethanolamine utilization protein EutH n=1 Tax=Salmonella enterica TaxID=28901 RepID=UPI000AF108ED